MNRRREQTIRLMTLLLLCSLAGCSAFRPIKGIPARFLPEELKAESRSHMETLNPSLLGRDRPAQHVVDRGDILGIYIEGVLGKLGEAPPVNFPQDRHGNPSIGFPLEVRDDGTISIPLAGAVDVRGMTVRQVEEHLRNLFVHQKKVLKQGQDRIIVTLQKPRQIRVLVLRQEGGVSGNSSAGLEFAQAQGLNLGRAKHGSGKLVYLPVYRNDVLNAITEAGGLPGLDAENAIYVIRRPQSPVSQYQQHIGRTGAMQHAMPPASIRSQPSVQTGGIQQVSWNSELSVRPVHGPTVQAVTASRVGSNPVTASTATYQSSAGFSVHPDLAVRNVSRSRQITPVFASGMTNAIGQQPFRPAGQSIPELQVQHQPSPGMIEPVYANQVQSPQSYAQPIPQQWQAQPISNPSLQTMMAPPQIPVPQQMQMSPVMTHQPSQAPVLQQPVPHQQVLPAPAYEMTPQMPQMHSGIESPMPLPEYSGAPAPASGSFDWLNHDQMAQFNPTVHGPNVIRIPVRLKPGECPQLTLQDITLNDGDVVFIESRETEIFYTAGLLGGGQFTLPRDYDLRVVEAIAMAQGASQQQQSTGRAIGGVSALNADVTISASNVIIMRWAENGAQVPIKVDLNRAITTPQENILIKAGDVIMLRYKPAEAIAAFIERNLLEGALFGVAAAQLQTSN